MGIKITTDYKGIKVWRSDRGQYPSYAVQVSKKEGDTWINEYQKVKFKGSPDIPNGTLIHIKDGFAALETWVSDGVEHKRIVWVIMDYEYEGMKEKPVNTFMEMPDPPSDSFTSLDEDLPF